MTPATRSLLDSRYVITHLLYERADERCYAGRHVELAAPVRMLALHPQTASNTAQAAEQVARFHSLVAQAVRVRHPALARVRDGFQQGTVCFVVMDEAPGETLAARLRRTGQLSLREALALALQLCDALALLSERAPVLLPLVAITPKSLICTRAGRVVLSDLGCSRWLHARYEIADEARCYSAPELLAGEGGDVRADVYSVAAILYASLAGRPLPTDPEEREPLARVEPFVPAALSDVVERALCSDPAERFASPAEFGAALAAAMYSSLPALVALINSPRPPAAEQAKPRKDTPPDHVSLSTPTPTPTSTPTSTPTLRRSPHDDHATAARLHTARPSSFRAMRLPQLWAQGAHRLASALRLDE